ncbi:MAG: DUF4438 domain-containing protein [Candidatus Bathyarchaeota archaeon]|jgi:hypothetical protein|nr:DUF4438 domain-containing protein [Candidatus Bathyarchaeota archaeon A05DMB-3]MDH7606199.1 DUF4438 domain-containing protein [Candidatus Bathyarchaeota archaeon]
MLRTNIGKLVKISVVGEVASPVYGRGVYNISAEGVPMVLPGVGGITYNVRVGDPACGWEADHVEPGVSIENKENDPRFGQGANTALNVLSCVGNEAIVVSGDAKGAKGVVTGKHGGIEHVLVDFQLETLEKLMLGDKVLVKAFGVGLKLLDFPEVKVMNMDPRFLEALDPKPNGDKLEVPVTHIIPAAVMGSGLGANQTYSGDYDIQLFDESTRREYGLDDLRLGDLVAILDADHSYGRIYRKGAVSVGIVVHTNCVTSGHGPGVTTLFTSSTGKIVPKIDSKANIAAILRLRTDI